MNASNIPSEFLPFHQMFSASSAEYALEGHPDKLADIIADALLDEYLRRDPNARVACEVLVAKHQVVVAGEVTALDAFDVESVVRRTIREIGYVDRCIGLSADDCRIVTSISEQSQSLRQVLDPVGQSGPLPANDQAIVVGFATRNRFGMIPPASFMAKTIAAKIAHLRRSRQFPFLWPDGKTLVQLEHDEMGTNLVRLVVVTSQHSPEATEDQVSACIRSVLPSSLIGAVVDETTVIQINPPSGRFSFGGPAADTGLTGRKVVADAYGPTVPHGGGSLSGKDPSKIDRCGAYAARWIAKSLVASGAAEDATVAMAYVIGIPQPVSVSVTCPRGTARTERQLESLIRQTFDLRPGALIERMGLRRPIFLHATLQGHFGLDDQLPWEQARTDL